MSGFVFSVVIPTFRRPDVLAKTLECLERQNCNFAFEVIVVNDGPAEELPKLRFGKGKRANWKLLQNKENLRRAATRNRGIREAKGEYILMLDDDIWAVPGLLNAHYEKQKEIHGGVVVGAVPPAKEIENTVWHRYIARNYERIHDRLKKDILDFGLFLTGNVSIPTTVLKQSNGFDERFKEYSFEDSELGYRLHSKGIRFAHTSEAIGCHFFSENLDTICSKAYASGRSLALFVKLHPELFYKMQCHSISILPWKGRDILKNSIKKIMFTGLSGMILKTLVTILNKGGCRKAAVCLLPWLELICRAKGFKNGKDQQ